MKVNGETDSIKFLKKRVVYAFSDLLCVFSILINEQNGQWIERH